MSSIKFFEVSFLKIGVCTVIDEVLCFKDVADYVELRLTQIAEMTDEQFDKLKKLLIENELSVEATNFFFPGNIKICGPDVNVDMLKKYADGALKRAAELGVGICVLGSGGARMIPEDMTYEDGMKQICECLKIIGDCAAKYDITIVLEPLNRMEANAIVSVSEGADIVRNLKHPNIKLLADIYHMAKENESLDSIVKNSDILLHTHIANPDGRLCPLSEEEFDYRSVKTVFDDAGYNLRISVEPTKIDNFVESATNSIKFLKTIF